MNKRIFIICKK